MRKVIVALKRPNLWFLLLLLIGNGLAWASAMAPRPGVPTSQSASLASSSVGNSPTTIVPESMKEMPAWLAADFTKPSAS